MNKKITEKITGLLISIFLHGKKIAPPYIFLYMAQTLWSVCSTPMTRENQQLVTNEPVEFKK